MEKDAQMRVLPAGVALSVLLAAAPAGPAHAACDPDLDPVPSIYGYKPRSGSICEGLFVSRVGAPPMELVSLTQGQPLQGAPPSVLKLAVGPAAVHAALHLRAVGIPAGLYYRMDFDLDPGHAVEWPSASVLGALRVGLDDVGVFAFMNGATGAPSFYPVSVGPAPGPAAADMVAELRPSTSINDPQWRFLPRGDTGPGNGGWTRASLANSRLILTLPAKPGLLQVSWDDAGSGMRRHASFAIGDN